MIGGLLLAAALVALLYPLVLQLASQVRQSQASNDASARVATWPQGRVADELAAAQGYNRDLASHKQVVLGEAPDPFSANKTVSKADTDSRYQHLLDTGDGVMGSILIPKISVNLPIYHGTSDRVLAQGTGHLYGTSLPVGGKSTHSVITGHRGLPDALLFTRLDELNKGDVFYIKTLGMTLGYRVDRITVLKPEEVISRLKITQGEDRVTLLTCTPYGVNTMRLLVSGTRAAVPQDIPEPSKAPADMRLLWSLIAVLAVIGMLLAYAVQRRRQSPWQGRHHRMSAPIGIAATERRHRRTRT